VHPDEALDAHKPMVLRETPLALPLRGNQYRAASTPFTRDVMLVKKRFSCSSSVVAVGAAYNMLNANWKTLSLR
jgi:hypothetical protein